MGTLGATTGLFYGGFDGSTNAVRAVAHEAGHAIHRQFMAEHQPIAAYNGGPKFMSESFAIFNELLLLDHLRRDARPRKRGPPCRGLPRGRDLPGLRLGAEPPRSKEALHAGIPRRQRPRPPTSTRARWPAFPPY